MLGSISYFLSWRPSTQAAPLTYVQSFRESCFEKWATRLLYLLSPRWPMSDSLQLHFYFNVSQSFRTSVCDTGEIEPHGVHLNPFRLPCCSASRLAINSRFLCPSIWSSSIPLLKSNLFYNTSFVFKCDHCNNKCVALLHISNHYALSNLENSRWSLTCLSSQNGSWSFESSKESFLSSFSPLQHTALGGCHSA